MQSAEDGLTSNGSDVLALDGPRHRSILLQPEMCSRLVVVGVPPVYSSDLSNKQLGESESPEARKNDLRVKVRILSHTGYQIKAPSFWREPFCCSP
jgi:hypothetical protein